MNRFITSIFRSLADYFVLLTFRACSALGSLHLFDRIRVCDVFPAFTGGFLYMLVPVTGREH